MYPPHSTIRLPDTGKLKSIHIELILASILGHRKSGLVYTTVWTCINIVVNSSGYNDYVVVL